MDLSACFVEIIAYTLAVARGDGASSLAYEQVRNTMQRLIDQSETCLAQGDFSQEDRDLARFAVFAWVDETLLASSWEGRQQWQREQLQRVHFQTADAGELFFERLNGIGPHQQQVREVYYLCLALGFSGQYCNEGDDFMLEQLRTSNLKLLTGRAVGIPDWKDQTLFPDAYSRDEGDGVPSLQEKRRWPAFAMICAAAPLVLFGVLYLIYSFILNNIGNNLMGTV
ncbi:DotU family type IV/VI secretion system protein [Desulfatitalea alkaliphila]|uniref:DotU family type IV/VI secretion system protein n=1 Tax=Desulfatitalea alkaliphila TaxID=2929485 RepID=A0AA41R2I3_9BACT|nr:DotU family type IV/VI secretion system protein [Desulfatitalea alkaliphila]MCJ8501797.1 DotU family type IV/VI secretion system protein [Desulfatitalea alkaliphila]